MLAVLAVAGWVTLLVTGRTVGAAPRLVATLALLVAGGAAGYGLGPGPEWLRIVLGALAGYLVGHTAGWLADGIRRRDLRGTALARNPPAPARGYELRTVLLPGAPAAGLAAGLGAAGGAVGLLVLIALVLLKREFVGAPLVALVLAAIVVLVPALTLRARATREIVLRVSDDEIMLRHRGRHTGWRTETVPLSRIRSVTVFADPYGRARMLRVDGGPDGRFELRCAPGLSRRGAAETLRRASRDLLGRPGWRPASGVRPYRARWGTRRYRGAARDNR
ncbi:hypothetical protein Aru02nite_02200 [Actinocatenispora rupis]|uniref:PH domain-containing protein n=1 Tax=Actinocatenispora rupis TaxID=519421 RepID=A0A8J3J0M0_9ACTN|nr:hypothetical protein Aru02nite_02200 [Actinocatenispora rupis]